MSSMLRDPTSCAPTSVFGPNGPTAELSAAEAFDPPFVGEYDENEVRRLRCYNID